MTAPGDPLIAGTGGSKYQKALQTYGNFPTLHNQVEAAMVKRSNTETELLWTKKSGAYVTRGYIATIESVDADGRTGAFQVHYVAVNDKRSPTQLTYGAFSERDKAALVMNFSAERRKGGRP